MQGGLRLVATMLLLALGAGPALAQGHAPEGTTGAIPANPAAGLRANWGTFTDDLDGMRKRRLVRVIAPYSKTIFFIDKGEQLGTAAEWGQELERWLNKDARREIDRIRVTFVPTPRERLLSALIAGEGDIVIGNLTITDGRKLLVDFAAARQTKVREILVTGPAAPPIASLDDLGGKKLYVRVSSSYYEHLAALNARRAAQGQATIELIPADEHLESEDLLEMVSAGLLPYVFIDDHVAGIWAKVLSGLKLRPDIAINEGGEIAPAVRKNNPQLKALIDEFVRQHTAGSSFEAILRQRYYSDDRMVRRASSPQDMARFRELIGFFRRYGDRYGFNPLMITAQGYQESRLDQKVRMKSGAVGVMQLLPTTAKAIGVDGVDASAERNIEAGNKYMRHLIETYINDPAVDAQNQTLFAFAAYNAGPGNLKKFRARAVEMGLNPNVWFDNVENAAAAIIGRETVQYVSNVYKYYVAYTLVDAEREQRVQAARPKAE
jgi:membrane-bound lytic murein transglycosylase MltF